MRRRIMGVLLSAAAASGLVLAVMAPASAAARPHWRLVLKASRTSTLTAIAAISRRDAWAAGTIGSSAYVLHWNGSAWRRVSVPGTGGCTPVSLQATSASSIWLQCTTRNGAIKTITGNGSAWSAVTEPIAPLWVATSATVTWSATYTDCTGGPGGSPGSCSTGVTRDDNGTDTTYTVPGYVVAMTPAAGRVYVLAETSIHGVPGETSSGQPLIYAGTATTWQRKTAPGWEIAQAPQLAVSPGGRMWILDWHVRPHSHQMLSYWNGHTWTRRTIPASRRLTYGSWGLIFDGRGGVWLGPYTHWTGSRWVATDPASPGTDYLDYVAPVPGTSSAWAVGWTEGNRPRAVIELTGPRP
jgi:hypothetical protein